MKKIILTLFAVLTLAASASAFAQGDNDYEFVEEEKFAGTYYNQSVSLLATEKTLEETLLEAWTDLDESIYISNYSITESEIETVYRGILYNYPQLFYVSNGFGYRCNSSGIVTDIKPVYKETDASVIADTLKSIDDATDEIMMYVDDDMTDFEKIMAVHDYMVLNYTYDYTYSNYNITIMKTKTGVCMAYALAFKHLMNELDIECVYVSSEPMDHGWNLVKLDGEWYHIDLTWDDPGTNFGQASHKFALLSDYEIQHIENDPHYGYNLNGLEATSDKYDNAPWHSGVGAIVTIGDVYYYVDGQNLVDSNGNVVYSGLNEGDSMWQIGEGYYFTNLNFTGVAEYNGILFFNTDKTVYAYHPHNKMLNKVLEGTGFCGLYIDGNTLKFCRYDRTEENFVKWGEKVLGPVRFGGTTYENNKIVRRLYKEPGTEDICIFADCGEYVDMKQVTEPGFSKAEFDAHKCKAIFFWDNQLTPLKGKEIYK